MPELRKKNTALDELIASYTPGKMSRRNFLKQAIALGVSVTAANSLMAAVAEAAVDPVKGAHLALQEAKSGGVLTEGYDRDFSPMDPVMSPWADPAYVAIYEFPMIRDFDGIPVPALAESWEISEDSLTWTLKIRDGLKFHSGADCTAANVVEDFELFRGLETGQNSVFWASVDTISEGEGNTVVMTLSKPFAAFPETLATEYSMIHNQAVRAELGDAYGAEGVDGTGPFKLETFSAGNEVRVVRWDDYAGSVTPFLENKGVAYLDEVRWIPILETANRANELEAGDADVVKNPAPQDVPRLVANQDIVVVEFPALANFFISLNAQRTELGFDDIRVRQAISGAIDRNGIAAALFFGRAVGTQGPIAPNWKWYEPGVEAFNNYDPDASAALLDEAGWTMGSDGVREKDGNKLSFDVLISSVQTNAVLTAEAASGMLANIGVEMKPRNLEPGDFFANLNDEAQAYGFEWLWSAPLDVVILFKLLPSDAFTGGTMPELNDAFAAWQGARSDEELMAAASRTQLLMAENLPMIPIVTTFNIWAHHKRVHGYRPSNANLYPLYNDVWIE